MTLYADLIVALAVLLVGQCILSRFGWFHDLAMERLARRAGLGIPADLESVIRPRVASRLLGGGVGGLVGLGLGMLVLIAARAPFEYIEMFLVLALASAGSGVGTIWASVRAELRAPRAGARSARVRVVTVSDYVFLPIRFVAWGAVAICAVLVITPLALAPEGAAQALRSGAAIPSSSFLFASVACVVLFEVVARWFVGRGQPATSTDELVWSDALRSIDLRIFLADTVRLVALGIWFPAATALDGNRNPGLTGVTAIAIAALFLLMLTFAFLTWSTKGWYLERLWHGSRRRTADEEARRVADLQRRAEARGVDDDTRLGRVVPR